MMNRSKNSRHLPLILPVKAMFYAQGNANKNVFIHLMPGDNKVDLFKNYAVNCYFFKLMIF